MELLALLLIIAVFYAAEVFLYTRFWRKGLDYRCYFTSEEVTEGDEAELVEEISNRKLLPLCWLKAELTTSKWLEFSDMQSSESGSARYVSSFFMLKGYRKIIRHRRVKCLKRGVFGIDMAAIVASDIFGGLNLSHSVERSAYETKIRVLPRPAELDEIPEKSGVMGDCFVRRTLLTDPFFYNGIREYENGSALGRISHKATARLQKLMVLQNDFTADRNTIVLLNMQSTPKDSGQTSNEDMTEFCIKIAAGIICREGENGTPVMLAANGADSVKSPVGTGREHITELLRLLADMPNISGERFDDFLEHYRGLNADLIIVTPFLSSGINSFALENIRTRVILCGTLSEEFSDGFAEYGISVRRKAAS